MTWIHAIIAGNITMIAINVIVFWPLAFSGARILDKPMSNLQVTIPIYLVVWGIVILFWHELSNVH